MEIELTRLRAERQRIIRIAKGMCITCGAPLEPVVGTCPHWWTGDGVPPRGKHVPHPEQI